MHSTLRKELCGTPKILQSVRTRPVRRFPPRSRKFSSRTWLLNQSGPKDNSANCSGTNSKSAENSNDSSSKPDLPAHKISADLEKWIQILSDRGQSLDVWDTISEKDENGRRRLLPHIKKDLEKLGPWKNQDGGIPQGFGLEIRDGRIRSLTPTELRQEREAGLNNSKPSEKIIVRSSSEGDLLGGQETSKASGVTGATETQQRNQRQDSQGPTGNGDDNGASVFEGNPVSKFHGSSAARRQRERQSRIREKPQIIILPEWFQQRNVQLWSEKTLDAAKSMHVQPVLDDEGALNDSTVADTDGPSNSTEAEVTQVMKESMENKAQQDNAPVEKEQTHSSSPSSDQPASNPASSSNSSIPSRSDANTLLALPNAKKRYYIQEAQRKELALTARGRLRLPASGSVGNKPGGIRSHLLVHYTANDGDLFLDRLVEDVAHELECNLITLDAQDISALISKADIDPMMVDEAKTLSYEIYNEIYKEESQEEDHASFFPEEMDEGDEEGGPPGPQGIPFMVGKPITIDLKAMFGPGSSRRGNNPFMPKSMMQELAGRGSMAKPTPHVFQSLVDSILSSPNSRRRSSSPDTQQEVDEEKSKAASVSQDQIREATIVHVKDLKAIQETNIGKHFLSQLYEQVERRRSNGERIMLIGTSCERGPISHYDAERIRNLQVSEPEEMSSTIVITPPYPYLASESDSESGLRHEIQRTIVPRQDRAKRIQMINARHLYEMLQSKDVPLDSLKEGFWARDLEEQLDEADQDCLSKMFWSFSYVQRLAAILASSDFSKSTHQIAEAAEILDLSDKLKYSWAKQTQQDKSRHSKKDKDSDDHENDKIAQIRSKATKHEKRLLSGVVEPRKIRTTFNDIHIPAETVEALQTLTTLSLVRPDAFKYGVLASDRIPGLLLYGPPGTGKTLAAKAVARESGATMLEVSAADINDMYVGEGEKNVKALFSLAKKLSPCVVFLDEADAMFSARSNAGRRVSHRELLNQFLKEWDGMSNDSGSAFIMVATNRPMDLDEAVLRRLPRRLLVDLPTEKDRLEILKIHLRHEQVAEDVNLAEIAARTQFYSGSDLKNIAVGAALNCVREENSQAKEYTGSGAYKYPEKRTLTMQHFEKALEEITASISEDMASLREIKKFDEQYGDRKGRKRRSPKWGFITPAEADAVLDTVKVRS